MDKQNLHHVLESFRSEVTHLLGDQIVGIYLYGSQARGEARPDSDVDILIVLRGEFNYSELLDKTLDIVARISLENDIVLSRSFVSEERFNNEMSPFLMNVRREAVAV